MLFKGKLQLIYFIGVVALVAAIMVTFALISTDLLLIILSGVVIAVICVVVYFGLVVSYFYYVPTTIKGIRKGGALSRELDLARRTQSYDTVTSVYELYKRNTKIRAPNLIDLEVGANGKNYLEIIELEDNVFVPAPRLTFKDKEEIEVLITDPETGKTRLEKKQVPRMELLASGQQDLHFSAYEMEKAIEDTVEKKNPWLENAPMIGLIGVIIVAVIALSIIFPAVQQIAAQASSACAMNLESTQKAIDTLEIVCNRNINGSMPIPVITNTTW